MNIAKKVFKKILQHKIYSLIALIVIIGGGYFAYQTWFVSSVATVQYITAKAEKGTLVVSVSGTGQISASNETNVQCRNSGIVVSVPAVNNQNVKSGDLIAIIDPTDHQNAVKNAAANLENAKLSYDELVGYSTSTVLKTQAALVQAQQSQTNAVNNLSSDYNAAYTDISKAFVDLPSVITGLNNVLYSTAINKVQSDIDAYSNLISADFPSVSDYNLAAANAYSDAKASYDNTITDYKNTTVNSGTSTVESLLQETYKTLKAISVANASAKNLLDVINNKLQEKSRSVPSQLAADESNVQSYISTINTHLSTFISIQNSLSNDKQSIITNNLSLQQAQLALDELNQGPTELQLKQSKLSITQAENSLSSAQSALANDYVRAPSNGTITNLAVNVGQTCSGTAAVFLSKTQLAQATFNEVDIVNIKTGQKATITFDALPNITLTGKVSEVDAIGTVTQGVVSYGIKVALDVPNDQIKPGMSDSVAVITNVKEDTLVVSNSAVSTKQGISTVQVMGTDGKPKAIEVVTGISNDAMTEILSGLNEGDGIVTQTITNSTTKTATSQTTGSSGLGGIRIPGVTGGGR
ncbi:MAG: HlyD family efflux transporter periplasmic adaptor subunit [Candidatus Wolfebacteria bacterium]|nr:HlyD family efflux transporter periplasmic adaptor subunit [Candidatus Wolfebacteria bacterium]